MTNSENFEHLADESTVSFWPTAIRYGLVGGLILVVYALIANMAGFSIPTSISGAILQFLISMAFIIAIAMLAIKHHRDTELKGNISFLRAFLVGFVALFAAGLLSNLFNILYMTVIDPTYVDTAIGKMEELFVSMGMDEATIETQLEATKTRFTTGTMLKTGLLWGNVFNVVFSAIIAAIMKRKPVAIA